MAPTHISDILEWCVATWLAKVAVLLDVLEFAMSDHVTKFSLNDDQSLSMQDDAGACCAFDAPPVPLEQLPLGLIEDQV